MQGTITWFNVKDQLPPKLETSNTSELVLTYGKTGATVTFYMHDTKKWFSTPAPTHWAYINKPS